MGRLGLQSYIKVGGNFQKAIEHPLWREYCAHAVNEGAEGKLYFGGGLDDVEDLEAEMEAWNDFLKNKENHQDKSQVDDDAATDMASAVASPTPDVPCVPTVPISVS